MNTPFAAQIARLNTPTKQCLFYGLLITLFQIAVAVGYAFLLKQSPAYLKLCNWDCGWYLSIATHGYISSYPPVMEQSSSNVAFFPGYPMIVRPLWQLLSIFHHVEPIPLLILVAQVFAWFFWTYFLLILKSLRFTGSAAAVCVLAVLAHPASPYLILAYSESTFLATLLALVYWTGKLAEDRRVWILAGLSGFWMSATRLAGITMALYPLISSIRGATRGTGGFWKGLRDWLRGTGFQSVAVSALTVFGVFAFFAFCHFRFGHWDLYMQSGKAGWNIVPDYGFLMRSWAYSVPPKSEMNHLDILSIYGCLTLFTGIFLTELGLAIARVKSGFTDRAGFYLSAGLMFYLSGSGSSSKAFVSLIRYTLPVWVLLLLGITHLIAHLSFEGPFARRLRQFAWVVLPVVFFALFWIYPLDMIKRYVTGAWAA